MSTFFCRFLCRSGGCMAAGLLALVVSFAASASDVAVATQSGGSHAPACAKNASSEIIPGTGSNIYSWTRRGNYLVQNVNYNGAPNQQLWVNDENCWGVTTTATDPKKCCYLSAPAVTRGWTNNGPALLALSSAGQNDWTTKAGMGLKVTELRKAKVTWAFEAPTDQTNSRWAALIDVYFHKTNKPKAEEFPPFLDLMINQAIMDLPLPAAPWSYYALVAKGINALDQLVTLGGLTYMVYIDEPGENGFHQKGGHNIHLFLLPKPGKGKPFWGRQESTTHDVKAIIDFFRQSNPKDNRGEPLRNAKGQVITSPLITDDLYLSSFNTGFEILAGTSFKNTRFCVSLQSEPDCPVQ